MSERNILLTVAIPTFNRANYLDLNLSFLLPQVQEFPGEVEVLVSDNCSPDGTLEVIKKYQDQGYVIRYIRNETNIGALENFLQCYREAQGHYLHICGDDDHFTAGSLKSIIGTLKEQEYGLVRLFTYGYDSIEAEIKPKVIPNTQFYKSPEQFLNSIHYSITFLSGFIINRKYLSGLSNYDPGLFKHNAFPHIHWFIESLYSGLPTCSLGGFSLAAKRNNSGNYDIFHVFTHELHEVLNWHKNNGRALTKVLKTLDRNLLQTFFPHFILRERAGLSKTFRNQNPFLSLKSFYKGNPWFWFLNAPLFITPPILARFIIRLADKILMVLR